MLQSTETDLARQTSGVSSFETFTAAEADATPKAIVGIVVGVLVLLIGTGVGVGLRLRKRDKRGGKRNSTSG